MPIQSRAAPHLLVGGLTALGLAALVLSLDTAPPNAEQQLRLGAKNTVAAESFVLDDTITLVPSSSAAASQARTEVAQVVYRAPDRVRETVSLNGRTLTVLAIGAARYERSGTGRWVTLGAQAGAVPAGREAAAGVLGPFEVLATATNVAQHGDAFTFQPATGELSTLLGELLGSQGAQLPQGSATFAASVSGEYLHTLDVSAAVTGGRVLVHLVLHSFNQAPALEPPVGA
jgi:hypothetical protein